MGMMMNLVKYSRPDIANAIREFSKVLGCARSRDLLELLRIMKFVQHTADYGLKVHPVVKLEKHCALEL